MNGMRPFGLSVLVVLLATAGLAMGTSVRLLNLPEMVHLADRVFLGRCLSAQEIREESIASAVVEYVLRLARASRGCKRESEWFFVRYDHRPV